MIKTVAFVSLSTFQSKIEGLEREMSHLDINDITFGGAVYTLVTGDMFNYAVARHVSLDEANQEKLIKCLKMFDKVGLLIDMET